jgi:hypothetical protein
LWITQKIFCWKETNMSFVAAAASVGTWAGLSGTAAVIGGGAMIGAGVGGAYSALTGDGKILDSMLTGAGIGGLGAFGLNAAGVGAGATSLAGTGGAGVTGAGTTAAEVAAASNTPAVAAASNINPATGLSWEATGSGLSAGAGSPTDPSWWSTLSGKEKLGYGLGATTLLSMLGGQPEGVATQGTKGMIRPYEYTTAKREPEAGKPYYFQPIEYDQYGRTTQPIDTSERNYFTQKFTELPTYAAANGGQVPPNLDRMPAGGLASLQGMRDGYGATQTLDGNIPQFAMGGHLGGYSDGGQLLKGPGDGVSDDIPASINDKQPARLADGEFVIPARIVSELGNGSTDAGAKRLYGMMDRIQADRSKTIGKDKVAVDTKARKHLPA